MYTFASIARLTATVACVVVLFGCATREQFVAQIEKGSVVTEEATNKLLLLNIVRAYHRRPMHFVRINEMKGPMGFGGPTLTIPTSIGADRLHSYALQTVIKADQPIFGLQLLDNQDFYRGLTAPVKHETIQYFLEQGWPQQLVLHVFFREIEELDASGARIQHWINYPENDAYFSAFQQKLQTFVGCEWIVKSEETRAPYGPPLELTEATAPQQIAALRGAFELDKIVVREGSRSRTLFQPVTVKRSSGLTLVPLSAQETCDHLRGTGPNLATFKALDGGGPPRNQLVLTPRSTEGIVYYLGELARRYLHGPLDKPELKGQPVQIQLQGVRALIKAGEVATPVFTDLFVLRQEASEPSAVEVVYEDQTYSIPRKSGRSMHLLSLLTQLMALHNKAVEAPTTQSVRVIN